MAEIDHLVVGARALDEGAAVLEEMLGVAPSGGGAHPDMGTHNRLWRLDRGYLEVIAIDPGAPGPEGCARWFGLDDPGTQDALRDGPRLLTWAVSAPDAVPPELLAQTGPFRRLSRGDLSWELTVRPDGARVAGGIVPALIRWAEGSLPPSRSLPESGLRLDYLMARNIAAPAEELLRMSGADALIRREPGEGPPGLEARLLRTDGTAVTLR